MNTNPYLFILLPVFIILWFGIIFLMFQREKKRKMKTILVDAWNTFVTDKWIDADMQKILDSFPHKKIILTNANEEEKVQFGIVGMPYEVFSLAHNPNKTESQYYIKMLENFWLDSQKVIYFEHNPDAVKSAQSVGIKTLWFDKDKRDLNEVEKFLKENI